MNKQLRTVVLVDSTGMASPSVKESWQRLYIANPLRVFSSCAEALAFIRHDHSLTHHELGAVVLDHSAGKRDGLELIKHLEREPATQLVPVLIYAADIGPLRERADIKAAAFVRRPMVLKLMHELDSLCGLSQTPHKPTVGTARICPSLPEELRRGDSAGRENRKEVITAGETTGSCSRRTLQEAQACTD